MTKENIFKNFLDDPILLEKNYITKEKINTLKYSEHSGIKLIEVIKIAIDCTVDDYGESVAARKINKFLNSGQL
jgi:hypothetical protein